MDYQELFNYMANNHNVNLLESEMQEVISIVQRMLNNSEATVETPNVNDNEAQKKPCEHNFVNMSKNGNKPDYLCDKCYKRQGD